MLLGLLAVLTLQSCAQPQPREGGIATSVWQPPAEASRWQVDSASSLLRVTVYAAGPLADFGHAHAVEFPVHGDIYRTGSTGTSAFRLEVPLHQASVDEPAAREAAGLDQDISDEARRQTRDNMLGPELLDAEAQSLVTVESLAIRGDAPDLVANMLVHVSGRIFEISMPLRIQEESRELRVSVNTTLAQTDIGLEPYSTLGGGLQVRDEMDIHLEVIAHPLQENLP